MTTPTKRPPHTTSTHPIYPTRTHPTPPHPAPPHPTTPRLTGSALRCIPGGRWGPRSRTATCLSPRAGRRLPPLCPLRLTRAEHPPPARCEARKSRRRAALREESATSSRGHLLEGQPKRGREGGGEGTGEGWCYYVLLLYTVNNRPQQRQYAQYSEVGGKIFNQLPSDLSEKGGNGPFVFHTRHRC